MENEPIQKMMRLEYYMGFEIAEEQGIQGSQPRESTSDGCAYLKRNESQNREAELPIYMAALPNGKRMPLLKTMLTSVCERNCYYCAFRSKRDTQRDTFKPDEMAKTFMSIYQKGVVEGMFLSSGMTGGGSRTQDRLLATAELLRKKYHFRGYLHIKIMPGSEKEQVRQAMRLADRVSVNLEAPNNQRLSALAPEKQFMEELLQPLRWVEEIRKNEPGHLGWNGHWSSSTTQFVVGGGDESDLELLSTSSYLMQSLKLGRIYFSKFHPVENTPLENRPPLNPVREQRLYQASFLLRDYGFDTEELPFLQEGNLPLDVDPKLAWAKNVFFGNPLEINKADYQQLIRIPGIGPKTARQIINTRRRDPIRKIEDLNNLGGVGKRAAPFILIQGRRQPTQLSLW